MAGNRSVRVQTGKSQDRTKREMPPHAHVETSAFVTRRGLLLPKRIAFDKWVRIGDYLSRALSSSTWCLGDWLVYGEASFNGRYRDAIELTSLDYQTLRNHAWVARRFPMSRRRDTLSFTHHAEVASLSEPEQDFWLRKAEESGWSAKRLRREVKASLRERAAGNEHYSGADGNVWESHENRKAGEPDTSAPGGTVSLRVTVPADRLEFCRATASRLGLNIETWAARILLEAADRTPGEPLRQELTAAGGCVRAMQKTV